MATPRLHRSVGGTHGERNATRGEPFRDSDDGVTHESGGRSASYYVGQRPWGIGVNGDGSKLFTANGPAGDVSIVDVTTGAIERRISLGGSPWGIAVAVAP